MTNDGYMTNDEYLAVVEEEHPCNDYHCDIRAALDGGFGRIAAFLLYGALDETIPVAPMDFNSDEWQDWLDHVRTYGHRCSDCGTINYGDDAWEPQTCGNCGSDRLMRLDSTRNGE
jgi:DNA-directed RNA polymerase subunit RPC12/RpoP